MEKNTQTEQKKLILPEDILLVGYNAMEGEDHRVMIVGRREPNHDYVTIQNAFSGDEAEELYRRLLGVDKEEDK